MGATTLGIMTFSKTTLSIMGLFAALSITDTSAVMLSVAFFIVRLSVVMHNGVMHNGVMLNGVAPPNELKGLLV
jgi:hypothetical protein